jgi:hypothetical protein
MGFRLKGETGVVSNRDTNLTIDPVKEPPTRKRDAAVEEEAEKTMASPYLVIVPLSFQALI